MMDHVRLKVGDKIWSLAQGEGAYGSDEDGTVELLIIDPQSIEPYGGDPIPCLTAYQLYVMLHQHFKEE